MSRAATPAMNPAEAARHLMAWWQAAGVETAHIVIERSQAGLPAAATPKQSGTPAASQYRAPASAAATVSATEAVQAAREAAAAATNLQELETAVRAFEGCGLKKTARSTVFCDGVAGADVMLVGEAPGADEDLEGRPFVGRSGKLLDAMLASIGLSRSENLYITNVVPWRPPGNRTPSRDELAICRPFVVRHIQLAKPRHLLLAGGVAASSLLETAEGITKLRTRSLQFDPGDGSPPIPVQCLLHPAYLLRRPSEKALVWRDLLRFVDGL
jgi:uracil-DNA glycosylase